MTQVNLVEKKARFTQFEVVRYQVITHCYIHNIHMTESEIDCFSILALSGKVEMSEFCNNVVKKKIFKTPQTVRNCVGKFISLNLIKKSKVDGQKKIYVNEDLKIQAEGNIMLNYKFIFVDTKETK